jgi:membrane-associated phospholipid phosphatase
MMSARRTPALVAASLVCVALSVWLLDRPIADWAHALHRPAWCVWLTWIADIPAPAAVLALAGAGVAWLCGWRPGPSGRLLLTVCITTLAAIEAKDVLKLAFGRPWPETWVNNNPSWIGTHAYGFHPFHGGAGWASFPSGHTTSITAPCAAIWPSNRHWRPALAALPCLVAMGLIGADFHFLSDCLAGGLLGIASAAAVRAATGSAPPTA